MEAALLIVFNPCCRSDNAKDQLDLSSRALGRAFLVMAVEDHVAVSIFVFRDTPTRKAMAAVCQGSRIRFKPPTRQSTRPKLDKEITDFVCPEFLVRRRFAKINVTVDGEAPSGR
jgi:hypothetical protein